MSDEPIVISVTDGVSPNVAISLRKIATEALAAHTNVNLLQNALNSIHIGGGLSAAVSSLNQLETAQNKAIVSSQRLEQAQTKVAKSTNLFSNALGSLKGYLLTYFGLSELKAYADEYTRATGLVNIFSHSQAETTAVMSKLFDVAQSTRQGLDGTVKTYHQLTIAGAQLGATQNEMLKVTELVGKAFAIQGTPTNTAKAGILQLSHAMTEGIVRGRQFNSLLIEMPRVLQVVADHLEGAGGSTAKLRQMMLAGKLTSKDFFDAAVAGSKDLDGQFDKTGKTIAQAFTYLRNSLVQYVGQANQASGASAALFNTIKFVADHVDVLVKAVMVLGSGYLVLGIGNLTKAMILFDIAAAANPIGLIVAAIAAAITALYLFADNLDITTVKIKGIGDVTITLKDLIIGSFKAVGEFFISIGNVLIDTWSAVSTFITNHNPFEGMMKQTSQLAGDAKRLSDYYKTHDQPNSPITAPDQPDYKPEGFLMQGALKNATDRLQAAKDKAALDAKVQDALNTKLGKEQDFTHGKPKSDKKAENELENLRKLNETLTLQKKHEFDISDAREKQVKLGELDIKYGNLKGKTAADLLASAKSLTAQKLLDDKIQKAMDSAASGGGKANAENYAIATAGINKAMANGSLTLEERNVELNKLNETYKNGKNAILDYIETLSVEHDHMQNLGHEGGVINKVNDQLKALGLTGNNLTEGQKNQAKWVSDKIHSLDQESMVYAEQNKILAETVDIYAQLAARQTALNNLKENPNISNEYKTRQQAQLNIDSANARLNGNNYGENDVQRNNDILTAGAGKLLEGYKGVASGISDAFGQTFKTLNDGFADSISKAIVNGDSLKDSLRSVAITIETQLITSLIKLGVQWLVQAALGTATSTASSAALIADGIAVAAAWAAAEAAVSLASFGANAIPAIAGISTTHALSEGLAIAGMAHDGISSIPQEGTWLLDKGERVVDQRTNGDLKNFLANNNRSSNTTVNNNTTTTSDNRPINITVVNHGIDNAIEDWHNDSASDHVIVNKLDRNASQVSRVIQNA